MVYKVMLVDDESIDLQWLQRRIPWKDLGLEVAFQANSGFKAFNKLKEQPVDILLTDINMPIMSGLELARKVKELLPEVKIIFISGHEEFEYAKQALHMNALGYVLKPFDDSELLELLEQAIVQLHETSQRNNEQQQWAKAVPLLKNELIIQWLEGASVQQREEAEALIHASFTQAHDGCGFTLAYMEIDDLEWKLNRLPMEQKEEMMTRIICIVEDAVNDHQLGMLIKPSANRFVVLMPLQGNRALLMDALNQMIDDVKRLTPVTLTIALGGFAAEVEALPQIYQTAGKLLSYKMFLGKSRIIEEESVKGHVPSEALDLELKVESLFIAMSEYDLVGTDDQLQELFGFIIGLESRVTVYHFVIHLITKLGEQFRKVGENLYELLHWDYKHLDILFQFETIDDIQSWLRRRLFELSEKLFSKKQKQDRKTINLIKSYVKANIEQKITLRDVATVFAFSPNYLGFMFKEETGERFSEFLIRQRLERASELLLDPANKIYEITERIGYKNIIYFNRQFKEYYGMTPSDYRKLRHI
ncbi:response regulator [Paenibacillus sp. GCM10023252]|uniref:response regulator n=1 Tax=Paenibacillus sp. GCM10023252 TaxID=3252649 RepID=UPI003618E2CB